MNKKSPILFLTFISSFLFAQDYKQKFAQEVCKCTGELDTKNKTKSQITSQFGLCAFKYATPYKKELKRDFGVDILEDLSNQKKMESFGVQVGMLMINNCPEVFAKIMDSEKTEATETVEAEDISYQLVNGTVSKIEKDNFIAFHIVGDNKNLNKFYWISSIESNLDLPKEYTNLLNKKVNISYYTAEIFDSKINDYRNLNIISSLKTD